MLRVDLIRREGTWVCLEVNTLPGLTPESPYPVQVEAAGARFDALVLALLAAAPPRGDAGRAKDPAP